MRLPRIIKWIPFSLVLRAWIVSGVQKGHRIPGGGAVRPDRIPGGRELSPSDIVGGRRLGSWDIPYDGKLEPRYIPEGGRFAPGPIHKSGGQGPGRIPGGGRIQPGAISVGRAGIPGGERTGISGVGRAGLPGDEGPGGQDADSATGGHGGVENKEEMDEEEYMAGKAQSHVPPAGGQGNTTGVSGAGGQPKPAEVLNPEEQTESLYPDGGRPGPAQFLGPNASLPDEFYDDGLPQTSDEDYHDTTTVRVAGVLEMIGNAFVGAWEGMFDLFHGMMRVDYDEDILRACFIISTTYMSAVDELRQYFDIRFLYVNNLEYEVGYVIYEIVSKYQKMLEIYYLVERRYFYNNTGSDNAAPPTYMLYMYTNVLELSKVIMHLCNMLHELEKKYKGKQNKIFEDYQLSVTGKKETDLKNFDSILHYEKELKKKRRENKQKRKKLLKLGLGATPPRTKRPPKGPFPLNYGWSIEEW